MPESSLKQHPDSSTWRENLLRDGYALFLGITPEPLIASALQAIQQDLKENYDEARKDEYDYISFCPDLRGTPVITNLLRQSPIWNILDEAIGVDNIGHDGGQIALRRAHNAPIEKVWNYHIDGVPEPHNGLKSFSNFTALVGVYLSDTPKNFSGNFAVWPGSHEILEKYFRDNGPESMNMGMPKVELGEPTQLSTNVGDAVLCHYQLGHSVATNTSDVDRIAVYFRIWLNDIEQRRWELLTNIWNGWKICDSDCRL